MRSTKFVVTLPCASSQRHCGACARIQRCWVAFSAQSPGIPVWTSLTLSRKVQRLLKNEAERWSTKKTQRPRRQGCNKSSRADNGLYNNDDTQRSLSCCGCHLCERMRSRCVWTSCKPIEIQAWAREIGKTSNSCSDLVSRSSKLGVVSTYTHLLTFHVSRWCAHSGRSPPMCSGSQIQNILRLATPVRPVPSACGPIPHRRGCGGCDTLSSSTVITDSESRHYSLGAQSRARDCGSVSDEIFND
jgi:hypothetical protein